MLNRLVGVIRWQEHQLFPVARLLFDRFTQHGTDNIRQRMIGTLSRGRLPLVRIANDVIRGLINLDRQLLDARRVV